MTPFLQLALAMSIIVLAAKAGGYISYRLGQPSVLGELLMGVLLGPSVLDILHISYFAESHVGETVHQLAEIGVLLLMFLAGLDLHLTELYRSGKVALFAGILGVVFPAILGVVTGLGFSLGLIPAIFLGLILSATSVSISAQTLMELKVLRSRVGIGLLGAAVFDDILVVLGLSLFTAIAQPGSAGGLASVSIILLRMVVYLVGASLLGLWLLPRLSKWVDELPISQGVITFTLVTILLYGWFAEVLGQVAAITGAFLAGLCLSRSLLKERIEHGISTLAYSLFVPIFFVNIGLSVDIRSLGAESLWLFLSMVLVAVVGKVLGAGWGANLGGLSRREAFQLGVGMISRGEVGLIVASVGIAQGLINESVFSGVVGMVVVTTLITPLLLRRLFVKAEAKQAIVEIAQGEER